MGSNMNLRNLPPDGNGNGNNSQPARGNFPLARQSSVYSLTLDEFQNSIGGFGKDFGSMNMDEFLKNIWTAEETQAMSAASFGMMEGGNGGNLNGQFGLQRQGSLTLPRTLSQKTVDEVWKDIFRESCADVGGNVSSNLQQRQPTLGEMTLEEFLVRAGVVREDAQSNLPMNNNSRFYGDFGSNLVGKSNEQTHPNNTGLALGFGQSDQANGILSSTKQQGFQEFRQSDQANGILSSSKQQGFQEFQQSDQANGILSSTTQQGIRENNTLSQQQQQGGWFNNQYSAQVAQQPKQEQHQLFPKQSAMGFAASMQLTSNGELTSPGMRNGLTLNGNGGSAMGIVNIGDSTVSIGAASPVGNSLVQSGLHGGTGIGLAGLGATAITVTTGSPANHPSSDGLGRSNGDNSSLSPVPYLFNGGLRGRKCNGTVEKVVERRQRRMIKNRESAARSRARKQAYTMELEAEVAKLKEENTDLQKKQAEIIEMQKKQVLEIINQQCGPKKLCLRRTQTGPW